MMKEAMQHKAKDLYMEVKKDIESRLLLLSYWKKSIHDEIDNILSKTPIDEIKDLIVQIDESLAKNRKLKVAIFMEENPDFRDQRKGQVNTLILNSLDVLNENAQRELSILQMAISHLEADIKTEGTPYIKKAV